MARRLSVHRISGFSSILLKASFFWRLFVLRSRGVARTGTRTIAASCRPREPNRAASERTQLIVARRSGPEPDAHGCRPQKLTTASSRLMRPSARDDTRGAVRREPAPRPLDGYQGSDGHWRMMRAIARRVGNAWPQAGVGAAAIVQVENPTPIILSREKSVIRGIHGSVAGSRCMSVVSSMGKRSVGPVSRTNRIADP